MPCLILGRPLQQFQEVLGLAFGNHEEALVEQGLLGGQIGQRNHAGNSVLLAENVV